jgi:hypothetical protein
MFFEGEFVLFPVFSVLFSVHYPQFASSHFLKFHFDIIFPYTPRFSQWSHSGFPTHTLYAPQLSPTHATCSAHLILIDTVPSSTEL